MDSIKAFAMGQATRNKELMVFDWEKAAQLILKSGAQEAKAGLSGDWERTGGAIFENGEMVEEDETYVYLRSTWATPELELDGEVIDCFKMASEVEYEPDAYWPEVAARLLRE